MRSTHSHQVLYDCVDAQCGTVYTVKAGDTLSTIAATKSTTVQALTELNGLANPDKITPGQQLKLSPCTSVPTPSPVPNSPSGRVCRYEQAANRITCGNIVCPTVPTSLAEKLPVGTYRIGPHIFKRGQDWHNLYPQLD
ncbi:hypothetical protein WJX72_006153 [[Myrmecia] bisecta]|uniref:LysM domain-containing protein n=1 Tax=[Myrmecia] bisecta TaxID=41462 RepID=A0AAW1PHZ3_9CHLO